MAILLLFLGLSDIPSSILLIVIVYPLRSSIVLSLSTSGPDRPVMVMSSFNVMFPPVSTALVNSSNVETLPPSLKMIESSASLLYPPPGLSGQAVLAASTLQ